MPVAPVIVFDPAQGGALVGPRLGIPVVLGTPLDGIVVGTVLGVRVGASDSALLDGMDSLLDGISVGTPEGAIVG